MKMFMLSTDRDVLTGMRLAGADGIFVSDENELAAAVPKVLKDDRIGVLLLNRTLEEKYPSYAERLRKEGDFVVTVIPDFATLDKPDDSITQYVQKMIGA